MWWHSKFLLHHSLREKELLPELPLNAFICVSCFSSSSTIIQGHLGTREKPSSKALEINMLSIMSVLYSEKNLIYELPPPPHGYLPQSYEVFSSVQSLSHVQLFTTAWTAALQASLSITSSGDCSNSCPSSWWCYPTSHPLSSPSPPAPNPSQHQGLF